MAKIKDLKRMCAAYLDNDCYGCPLDSCTEFPCDLSDNADEIVDNWVKEHPAKTYMQDFFEKFPNAPKEKNGTPKICIKNIYNNLDINCSEC